MAGILGKKKNVDRKRSKALSAKDESGVPGPSPDPGTNLMFADIALRGLSRFARRRIERRMLSGFGKKRAREILKRRTVSGTVANALLSRIAMSSLPGAVVVGGGFLAKTLLDRSRRRRHQARLGQQPVGEDPADDL